MNLGGFPGGSVVNKPIANAGDAGSIPAPGRSYMLWSNKAHVPQPLSLCSGAQEPQLLCTLEPELCNKRRHCNEKPVHHNYRVVLRSPLLEKSLCDSKDPAQPKNKQRSAFGTTHVANLEFPHESGLILRCAAKVAPPTWLISNFLMKAASS